MANNRRAMRECHLGDVIGEPLAPMRPVYRYEAPRWIERGTQVVIGWAGVSVYAVLIGCCLFTFAVAFHAGVK